jgi:hypothetical protein
MRMGSGFIIIALLNKNKSPKIESPCSKLKAIKAFLLLSPHPTLSPVRRNL